MLLLLAPFFEVHESMFVSVQVKHAFNDACETAGHMFHSHVEVGCKTNRRRAEDKSTFFNFKPIGNCNSDVPHL
jgi:hypothetical protein